MLEKKEEYKLLNQAVDRLSPQRKLVFIYCKIDGNTYEQASNALGISVATVNTHMSHSIRLIKEFMLDSYHSCPS
jgi:RNA polymerase sigma-70 factor (ECF subfamily)